LQRSARSGAVLGIQYRRARPLNLIVERLCVTMKFHLLPYFRLDFHVDLPVDDAQQRLNGSLYPRQPWRMFWRRRPSGFEGIVFEDGGFQFNRIISGRNSFLPFVYGRIESAPGGARVRVFASVHPGSVVVSLVFAVVLTYSLVRGVMAWYWGGDTTSDLFGPIILLASLYAMAMICFWLEAPKVERFLRRVFYS
jgi:hypothetical protein